MSAPRCRTCDLLADVSDEARLIHALTESLREERAAREQAETRATKAERALAEERAHADRLAEALARYGKPIGFSNVLAEHAARRGG